MFVIAFLLAVQQQQGVDTAKAGLPASPVARVVVTPANPTVTVGDSLRLGLQAVDVGGHPVAEAKVRCFGHSFEGRMDSTGVFHAGAPGHLTLHCVGAVPGTKPSKPTAILVTMTLPPPTRVVVTPDVHRLLAGQRITLAATTYTATGDRRTGDVTWRSSAPSVARLSTDGHLAALTPGQARVTASAGTASATVSLTVVPNTVRRVEISGPAPGTPIRTGDVVQFHAVARDAQGKVVADVMPVWSIAPGQGVIDQDGSFVPYEAGVYTVSASMGAATADRGVQVVHRGVRREATTLGRQPVAKLLTAEFWPHPNGRNAYLTTIGDRFYALDISDPSNPHITDSVVVDARLINDLMTTPDGKYGVIPREGASSRRNGIVILSFEDPAHPKPIAEYTETVTGGVHSTYVYSQPKYGTYVFLTDDATGSMRVIDINDPYHPKEVARWQTPRTDAGRILHDIDIYDGLAYLSYWNDGLVILDVGNGMKGGSPTNPQFVSQYTYDLEDLYRNVEAEGGPGYIRGTHTAWRRRDGKYVFVGDEVFSTKPQGVVLADLGLGKANGRLHVIDVSDILHPKEVAYYEPTDGGTHNVWVAGDTLYLGDYQGGLRVIDVSGDLKGDLLAQDREIAHVYTGDAKGLIPNAAMAWGAFYQNGTVWVNDVFSGLWAIRIEPKEEGPKPTPVQ